MLGGRGVHVPTCEEIVGLAFAKESGIEHKKETETITTLLILAKRREEHILWHNRTERLHITGDFLERACSVLKRLACADGIKPCGLYLAHALTRDARAVSDGFEGLALGVRPKAETVNKHLARPLRGCGEEPLCEGGTVKGERCRLYGYGPVRAGFYGLFHVWSNIYQMRSE